MGQPKKNTGQGRPGPRQKLMRSIALIAPPAQCITQEVVGYTLPQNSSILMADVECALCSGVLVRPLQLSCGGALCCTSCVQAWVEHTPSVDPLMCPCCLLPHPLDESQVFPAPAVLLKLLDTLNVRCRRCHLPNTCFIWRVDAISTS